MATQQIPRASTDHNQTQHGDVEARPRKFTLFPQLPPELRCKIWKFAIPAPKRVEIRFITRSEGNKTYYWKVLCKYGSTDAPVGLSICREARVETLKVYREIQPGRQSDAAIFFDFEHDLVYFPFSGRARLLEQCMAEIDPERNIRYMVVGLGLVNSDQWLNTAKHIFELRKLQALILVNYGVDTVSVRGTAYNRELPHGIRKHEVFPFLEQLAALQKENFTWKAPIVWYL